MDSNCRVSVIIPVFNTEKYLRECVDSILKQTLREIEIICVDDGSEDASLLILEQFREDSRVRVHRQHHKGVSAARNAGMDLASGKYLYFMDSDDLLKPQALELLYERAEKDSLDITVFNGKAHAETSEYAGTAEEQNALMHRVSAYRKGVYSGREFMNTLYNNQEYWMTVWLQLYRRDFCVEKGLRFREGIIHEDNLFTFQSLLSAERCGYVEDVLYLKRIRPESITTVSPSFEHVRGYFACHIGMAEFLQEKGQDFGRGAPEEILFHMLEEARRIYGYLDSREKQRYLELPYGERILFQSMIADRVPGQAAGGGSGDSGEDHWGSGGEEETGRAGGQRGPAGFLRRLCHKILPSTRYNVAWSYQHLTVQLQILQQLVQHVLSQNMRTEQGLRDIENTLRGMEQEGTRKEQNLRIHLEQQDRALEDINQENRRMYQETAEKLLNLEGRLDAARQEAAERDRDLRSVYELHTTFPEYRRVVFSEYPAAGSGTEEILPGESGTVEEAGQPGVTVIIPVYNSEKTLRQCLKSVLLQTFQKLQVICVDDGSQDRSFGILKEFQEADSRILLVRQENKGAGAARNKGLELAVGEYVAFLDTDDHFTSPFSLEILYHTAKEQKAEICGGSVLLFQDGISEPPVIDEIDYSFRDWGWMEYKDLQQDYYFQRFIYQREFLKKNRLDFPMARRYQDVLFFVRAMLSAGKFYRVSTEVYSYRGKSDRSVWSVETTAEILLQLAEELRLTGSAGLSRLHRDILLRLSWYLNRFQAPLTPDEVRRVSLAAKEMLEAVRTDWISPEELREQTRRLKEYTKES